MKSQALKKSNPVRQHKRFPYPPALVVSCEGADGNIPLSGPDISVHGMFINTPASLPEGTVLKIAFRLTRSDMQISVRAEVRYCVPGVGLGAEFIDLSPEARDAIEREIEERQ